MSTSPTETMRQYFEADGSPRILESRTDGAHCAVAGWLGLASQWRPTPPDQPGFYWLKRRDESLTIVKISSSLLCYSTHGHAGSKRGSLQGLWAGPLTPPSDGPNVRDEPRHE